LTSAVCSLQSIGKPLPHTVFQGFVAANIFRNLNGSLRYATSTAESILISVIRALDVKKRELLSL